MQHVIFAALLVAAATFACSDDKKVAGNSGKAGGSGGIVNDDKSVEGIDSYQGVKGSAFVVKNFMQLRAAADSCLGAGLGSVTPDMFTAGKCAGQPAGALAADKRIILGADKCSIIGQNIFEAMKDQLWAPDLAGRTDTLANHLTPSYLQALAVAADVYAHGVQDPASLCGTPDKAKELLHKCVAQFAPATLDAAVDTIAGLCGKGGADARSAIATILGSAAFAAAAPKDGLADKPAKEEKASDDEAKIEEE